MTAAQLKVLVVDDEPGMREVLELGLRGAGFEVLAAGNATEALAALRGETGIGVVITDIRMPGTNGLEMLAMAQADRPDSEALTAVVISADSRLPNVTAAMRAGALDFLSKPFSLKELLAATRRAMDQALSRRAVAEELARLRARPAAPAPGRESAPGLGALSGQDAAPADDAAAAAWLQRARLLEHELRTPLVPVLGYAELLQDVGTDAAEAQKFGEEIRRGAERMLCTVNRLLQYHQLFDPKLALSLQTLPLAPAVEAAWAALAARAAARAVTLALRLPPGRTVTADPLLLARLLQELLDNAIAYSPQGAEVVVAAQQQGDGVRLSVLDKGPGWPQPVLATYGSAFVVGESAMTRRRGGLGLGLAIVWRIVQLHGGRLELLPGAGGGSEARILWPAA